MELGVQMIFACVVLSWSLIAIVHADVNVFVADDSCPDQEWCTTSMPKTSHFRFETPPSDPVRWRQAQIQAWRGDHVLLQEIVKVFPNHFDFLDGDISFRRLHYLADLFIDEVRDLKPLTSKRKSSSFLPDSQLPVRRLSANLSTRTLEIENPDEEEDWEIILDPHGDVDEAETLSSMSEGRRRLQERPQMINGKMRYPWEVKHPGLLPGPYDFDRYQRAPIVAVGYNAFQKDIPAYFTGARLGGAFLDRNGFLKHWRNVKGRIETPFIAVCALNENWGFVSTNFPNRTAGWGACCSRSEPRDRAFFDFLDDDKTLLLLSNQHHNLTHPKVLSIPRGVPVTWGWTRVLLWDTQRTLAQSQTLPKDSFLFSTASNWGPRPQILRCISKQFTPEQFGGHVQHWGDTVVKTASGHSRTHNRLGREDYYLKLGRARMGLGLPGLGYDCFRNWELLTLGAVLVIEQGSGLDRTFWRLPVLLVEDFAELTPQLLRSAYVEALYRAKEFDFARLTMSWWFSLVLRVSAAKSTAPLLEAFPPQAQDVTFARPKVPYDCGERMERCGPGTMRTPRVSC